MARNLLQRLSVLRDAVTVGVLQLISRFTLWLACHGVQMPWLSWAELRVSVQTVERYKRRAMVAKLRAQRFKIARGPFFLRPTLEKAFVLLRFLQFPMLLSVKFFLAFLVCIFPFVIFFLIRIYLPVPQRIPLVQSELNMRIADTADVLRPNILQLADLDAPAADYSDDELIADGSEFKVLDSRSGEGILSLGRGGAHEEAWRGWRLSTAADVLLNFQADESPRMLRLKYMPISAGKIPAQCRIDVMTDVGQFVFSSVFSVQSGTVNRLLKSPLTRRLQEKLMPELAAFRTKTTSSPLVVPVAGGSPTLRFKLTPLGEEFGKNCDLLLHGFEWQRKSSAASPPVKKNLLFLLFKSLNYELATDQSVMPWLASQIQFPRGLVFAQHHALDLRENRSFLNFLGLPSVPSDSAVNPDDHLIERLRRGGHKVIMIGDLGPNELQSKILPDIAIRIGNETYQSRLALKQLLAILEEELTTPVVVIVRLNGLQAPWWPTYSDIQLGKLFFGGNHRGLMDTLIQASAKSLDRELSFHIDQLQKKGLFGEFDFLLSAERGLDLGSGLSNRDSARATFAGDMLLNQESLKVPLIYVPAANSLNSAKIIQTVTTHQDLTRTLWESLGHFDARFPLEARRLWQSFAGGYSRERSPSRSVKDVGEHLKVFPLYSRLQEGVLFADPDSTGGFLKYVSQPLPARISVPDAFGWPERRTLILPAGEQFRQVSRRGSREDVLSRVNSRFVRESRRIIRIGRRYPLRLRMEFSAASEVDLVFEETISGPAKLRKELPQGLSVVSQTNPTTKVVSHRIHGQVAAGARLELSGNVGQLRIVENHAGGLLVACPEAYVFSVTALSAAVAQKSVCLLEAPEPQRMAHLFAKGKQAIAVWLVEDEKQKCETQGETSQDLGEITDCPQDEVAQSE
ncbi:MAG: hypothetical protein RLZZ488_2848 [Pseudomonadota bacterium]